MERRFLQPRVTPSLVSEHWQSGMMTAGRKQQDWRLAGTREIRIRRLEDTFMMMVMLYSQ